MHAEVDDLHAYYGKSHILHGVDLDVAQGEIVSLLGRNGVGPLDHGQGHHGPGARHRLGALQGQRASPACKPYQIAHLGLGYVPENRDIFPTLTVRQNLHARHEEHARSGRWSLDDMYEHVSAARRSAPTPRPACCRAASSRC